MVIPAHALVAPPWSNMDGKWSLAAYYRISFMSVFFLRERTRQVSLFLYVTYI